VYSRGHIMGPRLVIVPVVAPKGNPFCVYHSAAARGRHVMFAVFSKRGSYAMRVWYAPSGLKRWSMHWGSIGGDVTRESQEVVVPVCVSAVLLANAYAGVRPNADMLLCIIFAIMGMRMSIIGYDEYWMWFAKRYGRSCKEHRLWRRASNENHFVLVLWKASGILASTCMNAESCNTNMLRFAGSISKEHIAGLAGKAKDLCSFTGNIRVIDSICSLSLAFRECFVDIKFIQQTLGL
jgi:hypothetical protein